MALKYEDKHVNLQIDKYKQKQTIMEDTEQKGMKELQKYRSLGTKFLKNYKTWQNNFSKFL